MRRTMVAVVMVGLVSALSARAAVQPASPEGPWIGTWKRNNALSTPPPSGEAVFTMWVEGDGFRYTYESAAGDGTPIRMEAFGRFDGRPYPEKGNPMADHNVFTRLDDRTYALIDLKDGRETIRFTITISPDGGRRASVARRRNARGEEETSIGVWDRVR